jgi:hypothetical protein
MLLIPNLIGMGEMKILASADCAPRSQLIALCLNFRSTADEFANDAGVR